MPPQISETTTRIGKTVYLYNAIVPIHELLDPSLLCVHLGGTSITKRYTYRPHVYTILVPLTMGLLLHVGT